MRQIGIPAMSLLCAQLLLSVAHGQGLSPENTLSRLTAEESARMLINLTAFTTDPGLGGVTLNVDTDGGIGKLTYSKGSIRLRKDFWLPDRNLAIYGDISGNWLDTDEEYTTENTLGETVKFLADRDISSGRIGLGIAHMITDHIRIRPFVSAALTRIDSKTDVVGNVDIAELPPGLAAAILDWSTNAWSVAGTVNAKYDRFWGEEEERLEVELSYTYAYHESYDEDFDLLTFSGTTDTLIGLVRYSQPTGVEVFDLPLRWNAGVETLAYPSVRQEDLGFNWYFRYGGGVDLQLDWRPYGLLAARYIGLFGYGLTGIDVAGVGLGISVRN